MNSQVALGDRFHWACLSLLLLRMEPAVAVLAEDLCGGGVILQASLGGSRLLAWPYSWIRILSFSRRVHCELVFGRTVGIALNHLSITKEAICSLEPMLSFCLCPRSNGSVPESVKESVSLPPEPALLLCRLRYEPFPQRKGNSG